MKSINEIDVGKLVSHIKALNLNFDVKPKEWDYESAVLILSDAILSVRRPYEAVVLPIIDRIRQNRLHENSLEQLVQLIDTRGPQYLMDLWRYKDLERVVRLRALSQRFVHLKSKMGLHEDMEVLKRWARSATVEGAKTFGVKGVGIATYQYLRIMSGIDTVKPDAHLKQAVKDAIGHHCSDFDVIGLFEATAKRMGIPARKLEYATWKYHSDKARDSKKCA